MILAINASYNNASQCTKITQSMPYEIYVINNSTNYIMFYQFVNFILHYPYQIVPF